MDRIDGPRLWERLGRGLAMAGKRNPWGDKGEGKAAGDGDSGATPPIGDSPNDDSKGPRNPWLPGGTGKSDPDAPRRSAGIEDIFRKRGPEGPRRGGDGGGGFRLPESPINRAWFPLAIALIVAVWLSFSMVHQVGPKERGIVTTFGKYSRTLQPGLNMTLPWPIQKVDVEDFTEFRVETIPADGPQRLMLTGDKNLVDLSYTVRWNIKDLKQYRFQLDDPTETVRDVAEAAMRASVAEKSLNEVLSGAGRAEIEQGVMSRMQAILDGYRSGIAIQGVQIRKTDPPKEVEDAFKDVSAAQQEAESYVNQAEAAAQQILNRAQGDAAAFDKVYAQYKLAPEVTRQRMYYETMERVLSNNDKVIVESPGVTTYLPLPEIKRRADQAATPAPEAGAQ